LWWTCGLDPLLRSRTLETAARKYGLDMLALEFAKQSSALAAR
jgi:hypothetical protein